MTVNKKVIEKKLKKLRHKLDLTRDNLTQKSDHKYPALSKIKNWIVGLKQLFQRRKTVILLLTALVIIATSILGYKSIQRPKKVSQLIKKGETAEVSLDRVKVVFTKNSLKEDTTITIKTASRPPLKSKNLSYIGQAYEFGPSGLKLEEPVFLTLKYDLKDLPSKAKEDNLYLAVWENEQWVPLEGSIINKTDHFVTAPVDHFSMFTILGDLLYEMFPAKIESKSYDDLPEAIQLDLGKSNYAKSDVAFVQRYEIPLAGKLSSLTITFGNIVSGISGVLIGGQSSEAELRDALGGALTQEIIGSHEEGEVLIKAYKLHEAGETSLELAQTGIAVAKGLKDAASLNLVYAKAVSWVLGAEMDYINEHVEEAFKDLWKLNLLSPRVEVYAVYIEAPYKFDMDTRGIKYYYFDEAQQKYLNYHNNLVGSKADFVEKTTTTEIKNGLVAHWKLDEDSGNTALDSSGNSNNGTLFGPTREPSANCKIAKCLSFDGSDYVSTNLDVQPSAIPESTWTAWVYPSRINHSYRQQIISADDGGFDRSVLIDEKSPSFSVFTGPIPEGGVWRVVGADLNQWQHIAAVWRKDSFRFYKNGVEYISAKIPSGQSSSNKLHIGNNPGFALEEFQGRIDDVRVYNRALSGEEIKSLYASN